MANFQLTVTTLTPLHIGNGNELRQGFDFAVSGNRTFCLDVDAILQARGEQLKPDLRGNYPLPATLLNKEGDFENPDFFRYVLVGFPRSNKNDARLRACIKDTQDCAYIPGSSLKGSLRTALAWAGWDEVKPRLDRSAIGRSRSWAGQLLERKLFGPDPNHDLLRALQVSDLSGGSPVAKRMMVVNAQVVTKGKPSSPVELEAIAGDTPFRGELRIDDTLFAPLAERELGFGNRHHWLEQIMPRVQKHSLARISELAKWFEEAPGGAAVGRFYRQLLGFQLAENQAFLQLGWGTGWDGTTFGSHLQKDPLLFEQLVQDFRLHKAGHFSQPRKPGDSFPRSKRVVMRVEKGIPAIAAPLGWVLIEAQKA